MRWHKTCSLSLALRRTTTLTTAVPNQYRPENEQPDILRSRKYCFADEHSLLLLALTILMRPALLCCLLFVQSSGRKKTRWVSHLLCKVSVIPGDMHCFQSQWMQQASMKTTDKYYSYNMLSVNKPAIGHFYCPISHRDARNLTRAFIGNQFSLTPNTVLMWM